MKNAPNNPKGGIAGRLNMAGWRKHYVAAMTADEESWPQREPGSKLGRVFITLLLLHVFLIGAVVLYNVISPKSPSSAAAGRQNLARPPGTPLNTGASGAVPKALAITLGTDKSAPTPPPAARKTEVKQGETGTYDVRSGDNVPGIAAALGVGAGDLIKLNNLDSTELYPGRRLTYPIKPGPPVLKAMPVISIAPNPPASKPESFNAVTAAKENSPPVKLKDNPVITSADNPPSTKTTQKGAPSVGSSKPAASPPSESSKNTKTASKSDKPSKTESSAKTASRTEKSSREPAGRRSHTVARNETLYAIARKYGVKVDALQKLNGIRDPTTLRDGMKLAIPPKN